MLRSILEQLFDLGDQRILRCGADLLVHQFPTTIKKGSVEKAYKQINRIEVVLNQYIAKGAIRWQWESRPLSNM